LPVIDNSFSLPYAINSSDMYYTFTLLNTVKKVDATSILNAGVGCDFLLGNLQLKLERSLSVNFGYPTYNRNVLRDITLYPGEYDLSNNCCSFSSSLGFTKLTGLVVYDSFSHCFN